MKYPVEYIAELFSLQKPDLHPQLQAVAKINGLPPETVGMSRRGFFGLQNNGIILGTDTKPRWIRFRDSNEGHERAWDCLAELAAERGEEFKFRRRVYIESTRGKYPFWKFKSRRRVKQVQRILQEEIGNLDLTSPTPRPSGSFEDAPVQDVGGTITPMCYQRPERGEAGPSHWGKKQKELQGQESARKQKQEEERQDSGMTAAEEQLLKAVDASTPDEPESPDRMNSDGGQQTPSSSGHSESSETSGKKKIQINKEFAEHSNICAMRFQLGSFLEDHGPAPKNVGAFDSECHRAFRRAYVLSSLHRLCEGCKNEGWTCFAFDMADSDAGQPVGWPYQDEANFWYDLGEPQQAPPADVSVEIPCPQQNAPNGQSYEGKGKARMV